MTFAKKRFVLALPVSLLEKTNFNEYLLQLKNCFEMLFVQNIPKLTSTLSTLLSSCETFVLFAETFRKARPPSPPTVVLATEWDCSIFSKNASVASVAQTAQNRLALYNAATSFHRNALQKSGRTRTNVWSLAKRNLVAADGAMESTHFATVLVKVSKERVAGATTGTAVAAALDVASWDSAVVATEKLPDSFVLVDSLCVCLVMETHLFFGLVLLKKYAELFERVATAQKVEFKEFAQVMDSVKAHRDRTAVHTFCLEGLLSEGWLHIAEIYKHVKVAEAVAESLLKYGLNCEPIVMLLEGDDEQLLEKTLAAVGKELVGPDEDEQQLVLLRLDL